MTVCAHREWVNPNGSGSPLSCRDCGIAWPGAELPEPAHERAGYGDVAQLKPWRTRVSDMVAELHEDDDA